MCSNAQVKPYMLTCDTYTFSFWPVEHNIGVLNVAGDWGNKVTQDQIRQWHGLLTKALVPSPIAQ